MRRRRGCLVVLGGLKRHRGEGSERKDRVRRRFSDTVVKTDSVAFVDISLSACSPEVCLPRPSRLLLTRLRRKARTAFLGRASGVSRASEGRATRTPHRHTRSEDTRGCLSPSPRISSPTGARPRLVSSESSKPNNRLGTRRDASRAPDRPLEPRLCASRRVRSTRGHASTAQSRFSNRPDRLELSPLRADRRSPRLRSSRSLSTTYIRLRFAISHLQKSLAPRQAGMGRRAAPGEPRSRE